MKLLFNKIKEQDKDSIQSYIKRNNIRNSDLSFTNLLCWQFLLQSEYAIIDDSLVIRYLVDNEICYSIPFSEKNNIDIIRCLQQEFHSADQPLQLFNVSNENKDELEHCFPNQFSFSYNEGYQDYIYLRKDLVDLKGKKYQPKRNLINRFVSNYDYKYQPITAELMPKCIQLAQEWHKNNHSHDNPFLLNELEMINYAFSHFDQINLIGGAILVNNTVVAFAFGGSINHDTFDVQIEKATSDIDGAFSIINQQFAQHLPEQYIYINREEDLNIPGLKQAKSSYHPILLLRKWKAKWNG